MIRRSQLGAPGFFSMQFVSREEGLVSRDAVAGVENVVKITNKANSCFKNPQTRKRTTNNSKAVDEQRD